MPLEKDKKFAVLIDADNIPASHIESILTEIARYGISTSKRCYGDWTKPNLNPWKEILHKHAIQPIQQFSYTSGKNATDSALIIDAMDLLYTGKFDGFCLVSSDSDFTKLATRLREAGLEVMGFGEKKTPKAFQAACDKFTNTEILTANLEPLALEANDEDKVKLHTLSTSKDEKPEEVRLKEFLKQSIDACSCEDGWAHLGTVGSHIKKLDSSFDCRTYGFNQLYKLTQSLSYIEQERRGEKKDFYIRYCEVK